MRPSIANKTHYPNGMTLLDRKFSELFEGERGPGAEPIKNSEELEEPIKGIIVPHAPYDLAGPAMAWGYKALSEESKKTKLYIIIAQAQNSTQAGVTMETFQTPYGEVRVDQTFTRSLLEKGNIKINDKIHFEESTIEIQLPFLQYINKPNSESIKIVPIIVNSETNFAELSVDIKETLIEQSKEAEYIFISNLTSYGRGFKYVPFTEQIPENIANVDKKFIEAINNVDKENFQTALNETLAPISGYHALLLYFALFKGGEAKLEQNYLSGDINGNYINTISYATFVIK